MSFTCYSDYEPFVYVVGDWKFETSKSPNNYYFETGLTIFDVGDGRGYSFEFDILNMIDPQKAMGRSALEKCAADNGFKEALYGHIMTYMASGIVDHTKPGKLPSIDGHQIHFFITNRKFNVRFIIHDTSVLPNIESKLRSLKQWKKINIF